MGKKSTFVVLAIIAITNFIIFTIITKKYGKIDSDMEQRIFNNLLQYLIFEMLFVFLLV